MQSPLHIIDEQGNLLKGNDILLHIKKALGKAESINDVGVQYRVVGVFGAQSSGKSTLLNHLFGTKFETMDSEEGRQQTTKGAFLSLAGSELGEHRLFVMDFEGSDGMERGENQTFERQLALFALAIADTLIINMWTTDVGRFNAANLLVLRTVFEVNLQLFSHRSSDSVEKPKLIFVLRDFTGDSDFFVKSFSADEIDDTELKATRSQDTKAEKVFRSLARSLSKVWDNVTKPEEVVKTICADPSSPNLTDFFEVKVCALPHFELQHDEFKQAVDSLRRCFTVGTNESFFSFSDRGKSQGVPLVALPQFMSSCWDQIKCTKDLDIPTQRMMLSRVRCQELQTEAVLSFTHFADEYSQEILAIIGGVTGSENTFRDSKVLDDKITSLCERIRKESVLYDGKIVAEFVRLAESEMTAYKTSIVEKIGRKLAVILLTKTQKNDAVGSVLSQAPERIALEVFAQDPLLIRCAITDDVVATPSDDPKGMELLQKHFSTSPNAATEHYVTKFYSHLTLFLQTLLEPILASVEKNSEQSEGEEGNLLTKAQHALLSAPAMKQVVSQQLAVTAQRTIRRKLALISVDAPNYMGKVFEAVVQIRKPQEPLPATAAPLTVDASCEAKEDELLRNLRVARFAGALVLASVLYDGLPDLAGNKPKTGIPVFLDLAPLVTGQKVPAKPSEEREKTAAEDAELDEEKGEPQVTVPECPYPRYPSELANLDGDGLELEGDAEEVSHGEQLDASRVMLSSTQVKAHFLRFCDHTQSFLRLKRTLFAQERQLLAAAAAAGAESARVQFYLEHGEELERLRKGGFVGSLLMSMNSVPPFFYLLLLLFGANEIYFVVTSPVLLLLLLVFCYVFLKQWIAFKFRQFQWVANMFGLWLPTEKSSKEDAKVKEAETPTETQLTKKVNPEVAAKLRQKKQQ